MTIEETTRNTRRRTNTTQQRLTDRAARFKADCRELSKRLDAKQITMVEYSVEYAALHEKYKSDEQTIRHG